MSGLLLDTHVFIWAVTLDARLPTGTADLLRNHPGPIYLSVVSGWEIAIKMGLGKLDVDRPIEQLIGEPLSQHGIEMLPLSQDDLVAYSRLAIPDSGHRDPFDRMLVVQAKERGLKLLTTDAALSAYDVEMEVV